MYSLSCSSLAIVSPGDATALFLAVYALSFSCLAIVTLGLSNALLCAIYDQFCSFLDKHSVGLSKALFLAVCVLTSHGLTWTFQCSFTSRSYSFACIKRKFRFQCKAMTTVAYSFFSHSHLYNTQGKLWLN